jgi:sec-independent protein translocase protein TatA
MPLGLHLPELIIVLAVALLIFGPKKLPEMGSAIGKSIKEFRKGMNELSEPKDQHVEETKLPATTTNEASNLNTTAAETETGVNTMTATNEVASSEAKID